MVEGNEQISVHGKTEKAQREETLSLSGLGEHWLMFGLRIALHHEESKQVPWFTLGWICLLLALFVWSQWGLSKQTQQVKQSRENFLCFYLKNDYTVLPDSLKRYVPQVLRKHASRVEPYIEHYHRGGMAHDQARQWLQEGDWGRSAESQSFAKDQSCLQQAVASGLLSHHPKKRLFMAMASLVPQDIVNNQRRLEQLGQLYLEARTRHPWYGWGLIPTDRQPISLLTSFLITPAWFTLLWQVALLWLVGGFLERRWGGPIWITMFLVGGLLGNLFLLLFLMGHSSPILGGHLALAAVMGLWTFGTWQRPCSVWLKSPATLWKNWTFPAWLVTVFWLCCSCLDMALYRESWWLHLAPVMLCFGLGYAAQWGMQSADWLEPLPVIQPTKSGAPIQAPEREKPQPRAFKTPQTTTGATKAKSLYLKPDLKQMVKTTYQQGDYEKAVEMYRELYKGGQARLEDFDELLLACEKGQIPPQADDFLRAIRAAAFAKRPDKATAYYHRCDNKRDGMNWSDREQISLIQELKRAGLYPDALHELEKILDQGPDGFFFMDALILNTEILIESSDDLEEAAQLIYKAELYLEKKPQYQEAVTRLRIMLAETDGSSIPEIRKIPTGLGVSAHASDASDRPLDQAVDASLLADLDAFEQRLQAEENQPAPGQSWSELPMLILRRERPNPLLHEQESVPVVSVTPIDEDFLLGEQDPLAPPDVVYSPVTQPDSTDKAQASLPPKWQPDFSSIEVSVDDQLHPTHKINHPLESQVVLPQHTQEQPKAANNAFATLADEGLLQHILEHQAQLEHKAQQAQQTTDKDDLNSEFFATGEDLSQHKPPESPLWATEPFSVHVPSYPQEDLRSALAVEHRHELFTTGNETSMLPNLSSALGNGTIDPGLLLDSQFDLPHLPHLPQTARAPSHQRDHAPVSGIPTSGVASSSWSTDWNSSASSVPSPLPGQGHDFELPLFGGEENLQATRELSSLMSSRQPHPASPTQIPPYTQEQEPPSTPGSTLPQAKQNPFPADWHASLLEEASSPGGSGVTEPEIPQLLRNESTKTGRPISVIPPRK